MIIQFENKNTNDDSSFFFCELKEEGIKPTQFVVDKILPTGLNLLCGPSKIGKSWFALELALAVGRGDSFLGFKTNKSSVFYFALEDTKRRLYERTMKLSGGKEIPSNLKGRITSGTLSSSFLCELEKELEDDPNVKLVIVDTLQKIRGKAFNGEQAYAYDYREMSMLKTFADQKGICLLVLHHTRKEVDNDKYNMINGTNGIMGVADTTMILSKDNRMDSKATLSITGRDVEDKEYVIDFDSNTCLWKMKSTIKEEKDSKLKEQFLNSFVMFRIMSTSRPFSVTATELSEMLKIDNGIDIDSYAVGSEINKFKELLLVEYGIKHTFKRTSSKRIHIFEDVKKSKNHC